MGTRGLVGFVVDGQVKATYNHFDSYPSGLGNAVAGCIESGKLDKDKVRNIVMVDESETPTDAQVAKLARYANLGVGNGSTTDWYCLLRETQGDLLAIQEAGYMTNGEEFAANSLFCEWGYLVDMDNDTLEIYQGFTPDDASVVGRFSGLVGSHGYGPITCVGIYPFHDLPDMNALEAALDDDDDDDD